MTVHQCPKCDLRFNWKTEVDDHCWHDHPEFRHEYPAVAHPPEPVAEAPAEPLPAEQRLHASSLIEWLVPGKRAQARHREGP
ncbi:MAG TPA: hypothetical protein VH298_07825 [Jatrophihabitans sp.]|jgi:hypothetical protein|nr:hypothetical protein [Jatrophihabitans sp.]